MNDRQIVSNLLQALTDKLLYSAPEFAAALAHFDIKTTYQGVKGDPDWAGLFGHKGCFYVDVFSAEHPKGQRYEFDHPDDAAAFATGVREGELPGIER
ncbi:MULTISPECIES: hypothetical protein [unclassified Serratia (in: enterobacteria)]|uniref:hypothetical protein n=1 Tax=unclassified Serratia (in: enterobacteria) TaxID=2647522 RepID=UPI0030768322